MLVKILSGLPGSGKSTLAEGYKRETLLTGKRVEIVSADSYHMVNGVYRFDRTKAGWAHDQCLLDFLNYIQDTSVLVVVVDNTNTTAAEIAPYYRLAQAFDCIPDIVRIWCDPFLAISRNIHDVPIPTIMGMYKNMLEPLPPHWSVIHRLSGVEK